MPGSRFAHGMALTVAVLLSAACGADGATGPQTSSTPSGTATSLPGAPSSGDPVIAAAGDIACDLAHRNFRGGAGTATNCRQLATSDLLGGTTTVLTLGDIQYESGTYEKFLASFDPSWGRVKPRIRPAVGNHEYLTRGAKGYFQYFGAAAGDPSRGYYSYEVGAWHLIALNSNCSKVRGCGAGSPQERWLRSDLAAHPNKCTLAYWHYPRWSSGKHGSFASMGAVVQALYDDGAELALAGHDHSYERFAPQDPAGEADAGRGIRQFVVGTGGKDHYPISALLPNSEAHADDTYGVLKLTLHASSYDWQFVPAAGGTFTDRGTGTCH